MFARILEKVTGVLKDVKGVTLVEVAAVVAVTGTLAAVAIPVALDKIEAGKVSAAKQEVATIATAISQFNADTGDWPFIASAGDTLDGLFTGMEEDGSAYAGPVMRNADSTTVITALQTAAKDGGTSITDWENVQNHLVQNGSGAGLETYETDEWNGAYLSSNKVDPWGNSYIIYKISLLAAQPSDVGGAVADHVWILSSGPDQILETTTSSDSEVGDDIGYMYR